MFHFEHKTLAYTVTVLVCWFHSYASSHQSQVCTCYENLVVTMPGTHIAEELKYHVDFNKRPMGLDTLLCHLLVKEYQ